MMDTNKEHYLTNIFMQNLSLNFMKEGIFQYNSKSPMEDCMEFLI